MGKKGSTKKGTNEGSGPQPSRTLREESNGKKRTNVNAKSMLKLEHLKNLALWASGEASIPPLGAFFGQRLASYAEILEVSPDQTLFPCQRCESTLQPGYNCTVRVERNKGSVRSKNNKEQNVVVYRCHYCSHRNVKRGTPKGHMKEICPPKPKPILKAKSARSEEGMMNCIDVGKIIDSAPPDILSGDKPATSSLATPSVSAGLTLLEGHSPATPSVSTGLTLLESKKRKRNRSASKRVAEPESKAGPRDAEKVASSSSKRRRKSWTTLREIAASSAHDSSRKLINLTVPFFL